MKPRLTRSVQDDGATIVWDYYDCVEMEECLPGDRLMTLQDKVGAAVSLATSRMDVVTLSTKGYPFRIEVNLHPMPEESEQFQSAYHNLYFRAESDRDEFEAFLAWDDMQVTAEAKVYNTKLYDLCVLLPSAWLDSKTNLNDLAALVYDIGEGSFTQLCRTFVAVLHATQGTQFDVKEAKAMFERGASCNTTLTEAKLKMMAGGANLDGYNAWKDKQREEAVYEKVKREAAARGDKELSPKELKAELFKALREELHQLPKDLVRADNDYFVNNMRRQTQWSSVEQLAYAVKSTYANISYDNKPVWLKKTVRFVRFSRNDPVRTIGYAESKATCRDGGERLCKFEVTFLDKPVTITLKEVLDECWQGIDYDSANVIPHSPLEPHDAGSVFNLFGQYQHQYDPALVVDMELVNLWVDHVKHIISSDVPAIYEYMLNWFAHLLQRPAVKTGTVPLMKSKPGAGKNFFVNVFARYVMNPSMATVINDLDRLTSRFNSIATAKQLVLIDEALDSGNRKGNQIMKNKITEDKQLIERKGMDIIEVDDYTNYIIATNNDFSSIVEAYDRRYLCIEVSDKVCPGMPGAKEYWKRARSKLLTNEAGRHLFHWLLRRDLSEFDVNELPETQYKKELKRKQSNAAVRYLLHKREEYLDREDDHRQRLLDAEAYADYVLWTERTNEKLVKQSVFTDMLNALKFTQVQVRTPGSTRRIRCRVFSRKLIEERLDQYIKDEIIEEEDEGDRTDDEDS